MVPSLLDNGLLPRSGDQRLVRCGRGAVFLDDDGFAGGLADEVVVGYPGVDPGVAVTPSVQKEVAISGYSIADRIWRLV